MIVRWFLASLCFAFAIPAIANELDGKSQELAELRAQIEAHQRTVAGLAKEEQGALERFKAIEKEIALTDELLRKLRAREQELDDQIAECEAKLGSAQHRIESRRDRLAAQLRQLYKQRRQASTLAFWAESGFTDAAARLKWTTYLARSERALMDDVKSAQQQTLSSRSELEEALSEVHLMRSETADRAQHLAGLRAERESELDELRGQRSVQKRVIAELETAAAELEQLLGRLQERDSGRSPAPGSGFAELQGRLSWPVQGTVLRPFGRSIHPDFKTVVMNKGLNLAAPLGAPIRAVAAGRVDFVDWLPGYGRCVILNHGDGYYTLYAHASEVFPARDDRVEANQVIGEVGDTGSLEGSQLYFELRKGREALDPAPWLSGPAR